MNSFSVEHGWKNSEELKIRVGVDLNLLDDVIEKSYTAERKILTFEGYENPMRSGESIDG
jgi:hypothetical protein